MFTHGARRCSLGYLRTMDICRLLQWAHPTYNFRNVVLLTQGKNLRYRLLRRFGSRALV